MRPEEIAVRTFHIQFGSPTKPLGYEGERDHDHRKLRRELISEEAGELVSGALNNDRVEIADGCADLLYVGAGTAVTFGLECDEHIARGVRAAIGAALENVIRVLNRDESDAALGPALVHLEIVTRGVADLYDIPLDLVFDEVHASNMTKMDGDHDGRCGVYATDEHPAGPCDCGAITYNESGKVIKPKSYTPADVVGVLQKYDAAKNT